MAAKLKPARSFATRLIAWQKRHGRHDLPWQGTQDAYTLWLSEIMLQQTQVSTVKPYFARFVAQFPTVKALAAAPLDDVLALWSGLGYYSRARNLYKAANALVQSHNGKMPADPEQVQTLPGIGRSTAAAICVFAYGGRHAILDGNVKRVLARHCGVQGFPGEPAVHETLWRKAEALLPVSAKDIVAYTQGLMDLGASVCSRTKPACGQCPLREDCVAHLQDLTAVLPGKKPRKAIPHRETLMLVLRNAGEILLEKRPAEGIWGGLWSLPEVSRASDIVACAQRYGATVQTQKALPVVAHGFTHFKLQIEPHLLEVKKTKANVPGVVWRAVDDALTAAIPAPVRKIILSCCF